MKALEHKTVLVTGASGFIGSHLTRRLTDVEGIKLLLLSRQPRITDCSQGRWFRASLSELTKAFWEREEVEAIDIVLHLGAFTPKTQNDANNVERVYWDNLAGTRNLLESLPSSPSKIVFASTLDVYAPVVEGVITEKDRIAPAGLYGASKIFCEKFVNVWAQRNNSNCAILRYGHIFGPGEEAYKKLIPLVIRQLLAGQSPSVYGSGQARRDFLYVADAVEATLRAAGVAKSVEPINIVSGQSSSIREVVELLVELCSSSTKVDYRLDQPDGISLSFSNKRMLNELGKWPLVSLVDGLAREVEYFRSLENEQ